MLRLRNRYHATIAWFRRLVPTLRAKLKAFFLSIHNVSSESRTGPDGAEEHRLTFDSLLGTHSTPWVSAEEAEAILARLKP